jgi:7-cyano-7-deazaguanine reductase
MAKMGSTVDEAIEAVESQVKADLEKCVEGEVEVTLHTEEDGFPCTPMDYGFDRLDDLVDVESMTFTTYNETPDTLDVSEGSCYIEVYTSNLRSNCRITNQPDWGDIYIYVKSDTHSVTYESLLQYIVSMRKESHFHEEICECVYKRLYDLLKPEELMVACLYTRRGGIDINPIRATHQELIDEHPMTDVETQVNKTMRQ